MCAQCCLRVIFGLTYVILYRTLSDNGKEFIAHLIKDFHIELGVKERHGLPYHPQTQGAIERSHPTVKAMWWSIAREMGWEISTMTLQLAKDILSKAIAIYNHSIHSTTKCMPFELFHKRTDRNFHMPPSAESVPETLFSDAQYAALVEKAYNGMTQAAAKSVARYFLLKYWKLSLQL